MVKQILIVFFLIPFCGFSQVDTIAHLYTFGGLGNDVGEDIQSTTDGGYIVVGSTASSGDGNTDIYLLKVDSLCGYEWSFALGEIGNDWGYSVQQTQDKGYIVAGTSNSYGKSYQACLMKRDSLGAYVWQKTYGGDDWDFVYDIAKTYDGGFVFCGETYNNTNGNSDVWVVKINSQGDTLWTRTEGGDLADKGNAIIETLDSSIVVAGIRNTIADSTQAYILKFNKNGVLLWDSLYGGEKYESANSIIETNNGNYAVGGTTTSFSPNGDKDFLLLRVNDFGETIWNNHYGNPSLEADQETFDIFEDANGNFINVGFTEENGAGMKDACLFYIKPGGAWLGISPTYGGEHIESFSSFSIGLNGEFCMAGYTNSFGNGLNDLFLVKVDTIYAFQNTSLVNYYDLVPISIMEYDEKIASLIYPNPTNRFLNIEIEDFHTDKKYYFEVYSINGTKVYSDVLKVGKNTFDFDNLSSQSYLYKVVMNGIVKETGEFIIY